MAGVLPYLATSLSTIYLAWDINYAALNGEGFLLSGKTAELVLHIIEPIQIGYGAVVRSGWVPTLKETWILTTTDYLLSRRYPLGLRMGEVRRRLRLHPLRPRSHCSRRSLAHPPTPNRIRPHLTILRLHLPLLRRRTGRNQRPSTTLVHYIPVHPHFRGRSKHRPQPNRPRTDCR